MTTPNEEYQTKRAILISEVEEKTIIGEVKLAHLEKFLNLSPEERKAIFGGDRGAKTTFRQCECGSVVSSNEKKCPWCQ